MILKFRETHITNLETRLRKSGNADLESRTVVSNCCSFLLAVFCCTLPEEGSVFSTVLAFGLLFHFCFKSQTFTFGLARTETVVLVIHESIGASVAHYFRKDCPWPSGHAQGFAEMYLWSLNDMLTVQASLWSEVYRYMHMLYTHYSRMLLLVMTPSECGWKKSVQVRCYGHAFFGCHRTTWAGPEYEVDALVWSSF